MVELKAKEWTEKKLGRSYDQFFKKRTLKPWLPKIHEWYLDLLDAKSGKLLDVGCGEGFFLATAASRGLEVYGIDISGYAIKNARLNAPTAKMVRGKGEKLPWKNNYFDYVTCIGSLEHFIDPEKALREMSRILKSHGRVLIYVPNSYYIIDIIKKVTIKGEPPHHGQELERFLTRREWERLINSSGLKILRTIKYNPPILVRPYRIGSIISPVRTFFQKFIPLNLSYCFIFICEKA